MKQLLKTLVALCISPATVTAQESLQKLYPVNYTQVKVTDPFWKGRMESVAINTLKVCVEYTENKTGRIRNFEKAANRSGTHEGIYSAVYA